jgi:hypothetical protein
MPRRFILYALTSGALIVASICCLPASYAIAAVALSTPSAQIAATNGSRVVLPGGTVVPIVVADKISSANANVGDTFATQASADVIVNGWLAIAKGAPGQGEILSVDRAGSHGHPGSLGVQYDWIFAADGDKVKLTSQRSTTEGQGEAGVASTMTILSYVLLGPLGLFTHNFVKGHDVEVDSTRPLKAYVADSVYVVATTREDNGSDFAPSVAAGYAPSAQGGRSSAISSTTSTSSGLASPAPVAFAQPVAAPPPSQPSTSAAAHAVSAAPQSAQTSSAAKSPDQSVSLIDISGTAPKTSATFTVTNPWAMQYAFDCSASPAGSPTGFSLMVNGPSTPIRPIIQSGLSGTDVTPTLQQLGTFTLHVESHCVWHVRAFYKGTQRAL